MGGREVTGTGARLVRYATGVTDIMPVTTLAIVLIAGLAALFAGALLFVIVLASLGGGKLPDLPYGVGGAILVGAALVALLPVAVIGAVFARSRNVAYPWRVAGYFYPGVALAFVLFAYVAQRWEWFAGVSVWITLVVLMAGLALEGLAAFHVIELGAGSLRGGRVAWAGKVLLIGLAAAAWFTADVANISSGSPGVLGVMVQPGLRALPAIGLTIALWAALPYLAEPSADPVSRMRSPRSRRPEG